MERYEQLAVVGEGSYGVVMKCRHRESDQIVAVKKFLETEEDAGVRRMALREIRMLKKLKHENLVTMMEVFRYRKRFYLVFEYLEGTVLDELEKANGGLGDEKSRERIFQVTRAICYCHANNIIHRDVKPENILVSSLGVVKLCDFGFARLISATGEPCTEYVATRWYRAPELLVGEQQYGPQVDIWAIGCLFAEMMTGDPIFPGDSDIDQLYLIVKSVGKPCLRHQQLMSKNSQLRGMIRSAVNDYSGLYRAFAAWSLLALDFLTCCLRMDPYLRPGSDELLKHNFFVHDKFPQRYLPALREKVNAEFNSNPLLRKFKTEILMATDKRDEHKLRRASQIEVPRWRMNLVEGSVKRKFSCDHTELSTSRSLNKTYSQKTGISFLKQSKERSSNNTLYDLDTVEEGDMGKIQKSLENLTKLSSQTRPSSDQKLDDNTSSTPYHYQSLQTFTTDTSPKSNNILHPVINNITFKDPQKKSPNILQSIHNTSIKGTFNQVPLVTAPRGVFMKKLDRNVVVDNNLCNIEPLNLCHQQLWSNVPTVKKREEKKNKDSFTLPNLPGATGSPGKSKGKSSLSSEILNNPNVTPALRYLKAKRKYCFLGGTALTK